MAQHNVVEGRTESEDVGDPVGVVRIGSRHERLDVLSGETCLYHRC